MIHFDRSVRRKAFDRTEGSYEIKRFVVAPTGIESDGDEPD
jgi:hypothetical protein